MSSMLFEIVELPNGDIALRRADDDGEPLVTIQFSEESEYYLQGVKIDVARAMIQTGLETASEMAQLNADDEVDLDGDSSALSPTQIH